MKSGEERPPRGDVSLAGEAQKKEEEAEAAPVLVSEEEASAPMTDGVLSTVPSTSSIVWQSPCWP